MNKLLTSLEQVPTVVIIGLETGETTIPGVWCMVSYGVGWLLTVVIIRLSQPPSGDWLAAAWAWAELGKITILQQMRHLVVKLVPSI